jgi:hypothetical protein
LEHAPWDSHDAAILADLDPELHRLPLGIAAASAKSGGWEAVPLALSCSEVQSFDEQAPRETSEMTNRKSAHADEVIE